MGKTTRKLEVVSPVPADIDIANGVEPLHISEIAQELGLSAKHYDLYGKYKAKVNLGFLFFSVELLWWIDLLMYSCVYLYKDLIFM